MKVILEPVSGTAKGNLERARAEIERVLAFKGSLPSVKAKGTRVIVEFEIDPKWEISPEERVAYLKEWIPAKVKSVFTVVSISAR